MTDALHEPELPPRPDERRQRAIVLTGTIIMAVIAAWSSIRVNDVRLAINGWGPHDYVSQKLHPDRYTDNWPSGIHNYDHALPMRAYVWLARLGFDPETVVGPYILVECLLFAFAVALLVHTWFRSTPLTLLAVAIALCSPAAGLNLARFGRGLGTSLHTLYYGYAHAWRLLAIAFVLRGRLNIAAVALALTAWCHLTIGVNTAVFISAMLLVQRPRASWRSIVVAGGLCLVLVLPHVVMILRSAAVGAGGMSNAAWMTATKLFSAHLFPFELELFTRRAHWKFVPLVALALFGLHAWTSGRRAEANHLTDARAASMRTHMIAAGCGAMLLLTVAGVIISAWSDSPALIKLCLHRASDLLTFFAAIMIGRWLWHLMSAGHVVRACIAAWALAAMLFSDPGTALLPLLVLAAYDWWTDRNGSCGRSCLTHNRGMAVGLMFVAAGATVLSVMNMIASRRPRTDLSQRVESWTDGLWPPLTHLNPTAEFDLLILGGASVLGRLLVVLAVATVVLVLAARFARGNRGVQGLVAIMLASIALVGVIRGARSADQLADDAAEAQDFIEVQHWARRETAPKALFMVDPSRSYGWRDFSRRSSFGTYREWGMFAFLYDANATLHEQGKARLRRFGADVDMIAAELRQTDQPLLRGGRVVQQRVHETFLSMRADDFRMLSREFGIDYLVYPAEHAENLTGAFRIVYENDRFTVFGLDANASSSIEP